MSEAKFTKGGSKVQMTETSLGRSVLDVITNASGVYGYGLGVRKKHAAPLIAAAPEMYKEIERDIEQLELLLSTKLVIGSPCYSVALCDLTRKTELLAKARGEV